MRNNSAWITVGSRFRRPLVLSLTVTLFTTHALYGNVEPPVEAPAAWSGTASAQREVTHLEDLWQGWRHRTKTLRVEGRRLIGICQKPEAAITRDELMVLIFEQLVPMLKAGRPATEELGRLTAELFPEGADGLSTHGRASRGWESFKFLSGAGGRRTDFGTQDRSHVLVRKDGGEQKYDSNTGQAGLFPTETVLHMETLEDFLYTPQLARIPALRVERPGKRQRLTNGRLILEYDSESGLPYLDSRRPFFERIQELPLPSNERIPFARLIGRVLYKKSPSGELLVRQAFVYVVDSVAVNQPVAEEDFEIAVPAGTTIVDFGTELPVLTKDGHPRHAARRVRKPVTDVVEYSKSPGFVPQAALLNSGAVTEDGGGRAWRVALIAANAVALLAVLVWWRIARRRGEAR